MMMTITVREQIEQALRRVPNLDAFMLNQIRAELYREFGPYAVATTLTASFDDFVRQMNYVKVDSVPGLKPGQVGVDEGDLRLVLGCQLSLCAATPTDRDLAVAALMRIHNEVVNLDVTLCGTQPDAEPAQGLDTVAESADKAGGKTDGRA